MHGIWSTPRGLLLIVFSFSLAVAGCQKTPASDPRAHAAPSGEKEPRPLREVVSSFKVKADTCARLKEGEILFEHLRPGMSKYEVRELLGTPDRKGSTETRWFYTIWYSRFIGVEFDGDKVVKITGG